jgi:hypothetical protein
MPHSTQNFAVGGFSALQPGQRISPNFQAADPKNQYHDLLKIVIGNL